MKAHLHGGPHDGKTVTVTGFDNELVLIDPAKVTIDTFYPVRDAATRYRFRGFREGSRGRRADYRYLEAR